METSVETLEGRRVRLTVTLSPDEVGSAISDAYTRYAHQIRIAGFRSGKAPRPLIDTHVGKERVLATALEDLVEDALPRALSAENLRPIERPDTGALDGLVPGEGCTFSAEFEARPDLTLTSIEGLTVDVPAAKTTDEEIDAQIGYLRGRFASLEPVAGRGVQAEDFVLLSFTGTLDGEPYEGNTVDKYLYELGRGQMPPEFDAAMIGANAGDAVTASFPVPEASSTPEHAGKAAVFEIEVHEIKSKVLPELDDEFAANAGGFETLAEMRDDTRAKLDENKAAGHVRQLERAARIALVERLVGEVPETMVKNRAAQMYEEFFESMSERGITMEQYAEAIGLDPQKIQEDIEVEAAFRVRDDLALEALFRQLELEITAEEITAEIARMADAQETDAGALMERLVATGLLPLIAEDLMHRKAVRWLMENVDFGDEEATAASAGDSTVTPKKAKPARAPKEAKKPAAKNAAPRAAVPKKASKPAAGKEE